MAVLDFSLTNKPNYKERGDYGVRVARPGYDAEICAQNQLIFNSNWPILQITKVIDINKIEEWEHKYFDMDNGVWVDEIPASATQGGGSAIDGARVSKNYLIYVGSSTNYFDYGDNYHWYIDFKYKKYKHNLGYVPFFFDSKYVSGLDGYVILTSVNIAKDIDYPYTEGALPLLNPIKDYGIKSTSEFGPNVPGLCSNMFSKLVQAVKTTESSRWILEDRTGNFHDEKILCWSPFNEASEFVNGEVNKYEAFVFSAYKCAFLEASLAVTLINPDSELDTDLFGDGLYYSMDSVVRMLSIVDTPSIYGQSAAYSNISQSPQLYDDASMVILRSPMVSPEYEEVRI